jgi:hypothetical protein
MMKVEHFYSYTVVGHRALEFPMDMLRFAEAWPAGPDDAAQIELSFHHDDTADQPKGRRVHLFSRADPERMIRARWESFGWRIARLHDEATVRRAGEAA